MDGIVKSLFVAVALAGAAFAAFIAEAAGSAAAALRIVEASSVLTEVEARDAQWARADALLARSWARPTHWHGLGADVAAQIAYAGAASAPDAEAGTRAAAATRAGAALAPHQSGPWVRLAALSLAGYPKTGCASPKACLDRAHVAQPMLAPPLACERLALLHAAGGWNDGARVARLWAYYAAGPSRGDAIDCFAFLPPRALFEALIDAPPAQP
jgi:hypothetical protein